MINENNYFDHDADIGIIGYGKSLEDSFEEAAEATFALMGDLSKVTPKESVSFEFEESDVELAFITWLNLLIAKAQANYLILASFKIKRMNNHWYGEGQGEPWRDEIERGIDVKGATLTMLSVKQTNGQWRSQCVVDV
ncbi:Archease [Legionella lansingensis]|uniref:Archease domain-containing protein n=1 Tax=Legionella lansingensis TaxID=45067 RepID=A0A0W0W031_9GAMM|nr:archease [Legionella lansingensis]KTD25688.1 hypothetical protein Llan_0078 [Legionella lansingensis]SNV49157.1 Archease [Legionella lansingensis]